MLGAPLSKHFLKWTEKNNTNVKLSRRCLLCAVNDALLPPNQMLTSSSEQRPMKDILCNVELPMLSMLFKAEWPLRVFHKCHLFSPRGAVAVISDLGCTNLKENVFDFLTIEIRTTKLIHAHMRHHTAVTCYLLPPLIGEYVIVCLWLLFFIVAQLTPWLYFSFVWTQARQVQSSNNISGPSRESKA